MDALMTEPSLFDFYLGGSSPNGATAPTSSANTTQGHVSGGVMNHPSPSKDLNDPIVTSALDGDEDLLASHRADRIPIGVDPRSLLQLGDCFGCLVVYYHQNQPNLVQCQ